MGEPRAAAGVWKKCPRTNSTTWSCNCSLLNVLYGGGAGMATSEHFKSDVSAVHLGGGLGVTEHQGRQCADIRVLKSHQGPMHGRMDVPNAAPPEKPFTCHPKNFQ